MIRKEAARFVLATSLKKRWGSKKRWGLLVFSQDIDELLAVFVLSGILVPKACTCSSPSLFIGCSWLRTPLQPLRFHFNQCLTFPLLGIGQLLFGRVFWLLPGLLFSGPPAICSMRSG